MRIILASSSPRRREILELIGLKNFEIFPPKVKEVPIKSPFDVKRNALKKAKWVYKKLKPFKGKEFLIIASDTAVFLDNTFLGKPKNTKEAKRFLKLLSGRWHTVYTSLVLLYKKPLKVSRVITLSKTGVKFKPLTEKEIDWYISTGEALDKAGAYGIQGHGAIFIEELKGDYFTVMGLPAKELYRGLKELLGTERTLALLNGGGGI